MKLFIFLALLTGTYCLNNFTTSLISSFLQKNYSTLGFLLVCWRKVDKLQMYKAILEHKMDFRIAFLPTQGGLIRKIGNEKYNKVSFILDLSCEQKDKILQEISTTNKLRSKCKWLMIANSKMLKDDIGNLFYNLQLRMDMDVKIALPTYEDGQYDIFEIYDPGLEADIKFNKVGSFVDGNLTYFKNSSFYDSRKNMSGVLMRAGNVNLSYAFNPSIQRDEYLREVKRKGYATFEGFMGQLYLCLTEIHKFHYNITTRYPWFGNSSSGTDGGVAQLLHENAIDISMAGGSIQRVRLYYYDYFLICCQFRACFFFRNPGKKIGAAVFEPFSKQSWYVTLCAMLILSIAIKITYWIDNTYLRSRITYSFFTSFVIIISILTQQGSTIVPHRLGGRILFLTILVLSVLVYNYYTSSLVSSLLRSNVPPLTTIKELYESDLKIGIEDQPYTITHIVQKKDDYYTQQLNKTKIYHPQPNLWTPTEGLAKVKKGGYAYHTLNNIAYPIIGRTFDQQEICDLAQMDFITPLRFSLMLPKKSQYKELFQISLVKMKQSGIFKREHDIWFEKFPECRSSLRVLAIGINELFLVYMLLIIGMFLAFVIFLVEVIWHKMQKNKINYYVN